MPCECDRISCLLKGKALLEKWQRAGQEAADFERLETLAPEPFLRKRVDEEKSYRGYHVQSVFWI